MLKLALLLLILPLSPAYSFDCGSPSGVLVSSCDGHISTSLRILPDDPQSDATTQITVAGAYSSGDRFGVEGLSIRNGEVISNRFQSWDGILLIDANGVVSLHNVRRVLARSQVFNLKNVPERQAFIALAKQQNLSLIQSHLLISEGELDVRNIPTAPRFVRRFLLTDVSGDFVLYETQTAMTLFDATIEVQKLFTPNMVFNLDMGAYNYCQHRAENVVTDCGLLFVSAEKLTNLLEFNITP